MRSLIFAAVAPLALGACAMNETAMAPERSVKNERRLSQWLGGLSEGKQVSCISSFDARDQRIIDERTILFRGSRNKVFRAELDSCPRLDRNSTIVRRSTVSQICSGEIFEVRDSGSQFSYGSCSFGDFTEYRGAAAGG